MVEKTKGKSSFEERLAANKQRLRDNATIRAVIELAATTPGSQMDAPFAPIDPALSAAAQELVREEGLFELAKSLAKRTK